MRYDRLLDGKVAVVTGGGAGIGGAISRLFAQHGAFVEIAEIDPARGAAALSDIEQAGGRARIHAVDVRDAARVDAFAKDVLAEHGRVDVLVNNVGHYLKAIPFRQSTREHWDALYQINLHHVFLVTRAFVDAMIARHSGTIVNFHSVEGMRGYPADPVYGAFKAAVAHFTTCLAVELGRKGIRVNGIGTDLCQTPQVDYLAATEGKEQLWEIWAPVGRVGTPEDQAQVALFLASELSGFVTGHNIPVDGGTRAGGGWFWSPERRRFVNRPENP
jgi:NAD(P)-dependent dehydrogenase (short-subunit alcohol dehydrogenase family)